MANHKHSYSTLKEFESCPRRCHEVRILRKYPFEQSDAARYGDTVHKALEDNVNSDITLAPDFQRFKPVVDAVKAFPGIVRAEVKYAVDRELRPVDYFDRTVWFRCKVDVSAVDRPAGKARIVDWKTGKDKYPDTEQLVQNAMLLLRNEPQIMQVTGRLAFLLTQSHASAPVVRRDDEKRLWLDLRARAAKLEGALDSGVFNPKQGPFCRNHCVVRDCEFNGKHHGG